MRVIGLLFSHGQHTWRGELGKIMARIKGKDIVHDNGKAWVHRDTHSTPPTYDVYITGVTHSTHDSSYHLNDDGLSIAIARADYFLKRAT